MPCPRWKKGYHLLLEKPISPDLQECLALRDAAHRCGRIVAVAHVLRYTADFLHCQSSCWMPDAIGQLIHMDLIENVAYWHFAHSYVRGNWRRAGGSQPHDSWQRAATIMDLLRWLAGSRLRYACSSVGGLSVLRGKNAPTGAADRCTALRRVARGCPYSAVPHLSGKRKDRHTARQHRLALLGAGRPPHTGEHRAARWNRAPTAAVSTPVTTTWPTTSA